MVINWGTNIIALIFENKKMRVIFKASSVYIGIK